MYITLFQARWYITEAFNMGKRERMSNSIFHESQHWDKLTVPTLQVYSLGPTHLFTQSSRLPHMGPKSRFFHVGSLTASFLWVLCYWEVLERLTEKGLNLLKQNYKDWKRWLPAHQNADTHTRAWGAWVIRETHYHQMNKGDTVNHQIQGAVDLHPAWQEIWTPPPPQTLWATEEKYEDSPEDKEDNNA